MRGNRPTTATTGAEGPAPVRSMRRFWYFTTAAAVSKVGNAFLNLALPWTILETTGSSVLAALSLGVQNLPYLFSPVLGGLMDRYDRRRLFVLSELVQAGSVAVIPVLLAIGAVVPAMVVLLVVGSGGAVSNLTSDFSLVPSLSPPDRVTQAYARYGTVISIARCVGPAAAGVVLASAGSSVALWIDAATFLATAGVALALPVERRSVARAPFLRMLVEGFRSFRRLTGIARLTAVITLYNLGAGAVTVAIVVVVKNAWGWSSNQAGLALAAGAAGSAVGGWLAGKLLLGAALERRIQTWFVFCAASAALMLVASPWTVVVGFFLLMVGEGAMNVTTNEYRFVAIPDELVGRVNSIMRAFINGATVVSSPLLGYSSTLSQRWLWLMPVALGAVTACLVWLRGLRRNAIADVDASQPG